MYINYPSYENHIFCPVYISDVEADISGSGTADLGIFGWKRKQLIVTASASCFCFHVSILRLSPEKMSWFFSDCGKQYFLVEFGWLFWKLHLSNPVKKNGRKMFHFIDIFMEVTWKHGSGSESGSKSSLQIFLEAEAEVEVHCFHITGRGRRVRFLV